VSIQYALGYDHLPEDDIVPVNPETGLPDAGSANQQIGKAHFRYTFRPTTAADQAHITTTTFMTPQSIGKVFVRCFVAYDIFSTEGRSEDEIAKEKSCPSMPLCIKIRITGSKPKFVAPTPLGDSFDDNGILVPNRHDYPACQGSPMRLELKVQDSMPKEVRDKLLLTLEGQEYLRNLRFRIFVEDKDVGYSSSLDKESYEYFKSGGDGNLDFFDDREQPVKEEVEQKCGAFRGYGAQRVGNNDEQASPVAMEDEGKMKSVMSPYRSDPPVENCRCALDPCSDCSGDAIAFARNRARALPAPLHTHTHTHDLRGPCCSGCVDVNRSRHTQHTRIPFDVDRSCGLNPRGGVPDGYVRSGGLAPTYHPLNSTSHTHTSSSHSHTSSARSVSSHSHHAVVRSLTHNMHTAHTVSSHAYHTLVRIHTLYTRKSIH
jgi:hypothetical protein